MTQSGATADTPGPTPGPWTAFPYTEPENSATGERMGWHINQVGGPGYVTTVSRMSHRAAECEANARLIAAAPELLRVLKELLAYCEDTNAYSKGWHGKQIEARGVIAKATGGSNV